MARRHTQRYSQWRERETSADSAYQERQAEADKLRNQQLTLGAAKYAGQAYLDWRKGNVMDSQGKLSMLAREDLGNIEAGTNLYTEKSGIGSFLTGNTAVQNQDLIDTMKAQASMDPGMTQTDQMTSLYGSNAADAYMEQFKGERSQPHSFAESFTPIEDINTGGADPTFDYSSLGDEITPGEYDRQVWTAQEGGVGVRSTFGQTGVTGLEGGNVKDLKEGGSFFDPSRIAPVRDPEIAESQYHPTNAELNQMRDAQEAQIDAEIGAEMDDFAEGTGIANWRTYKAPDTGETYDRGDRGWDFVKARQEDAAVQGKNKALEDRLGTQFEAQRAARIEAEEIAKADEMVKGTTVEMPPNMGFNTSVDVKEVQTREAFPISGKAPDINTAGKSSIQSAISNMRLQKQENEALDRQDLIDAKKMFPGENDERALERFYNYEDPDLENVIASTDANVDDLGLDLEPSEQSLEPPSVSEVANNIQKNTQEGLAQTASKVDKKIDMGGISDIFFAGKDVKTIMSGDEDEAKMAGVNLTSKVSSKIAKDQIKKETAKKVQEIAKSKLEDEAKEELIKEATKNIAATGGSALGTAAKGAGGVASGVTGFMAAKEGYEGFKDAKKRGETDEMISQGVTATGGWVAGAGGVLTAIGGALSLTGIGATIGAPLMAIGGAMTTYGGAAATAGSMYTMADNMLESRESGGKPSSGNFSSGSRRRVKNRRTYGRA
jgi:hypothetical protein